MAALPRGIIRSTSVAAEMDGDDGDETTVDGDGELDQHILLTIDNFPRKVSEMLDSERTLFKHVAAVFEDRHCRIHKERVEKWEDEIRKFTYVCSSVPCCVHCQEH